MKDFSTFCYIATVYCNHPKHDKFVDGLMPEEYINTTKGKAMKHLRKAGWRIKYGVWVCSSCIKKEWKEGE